MFRDVLADPPSPPKPSRDLWTIPYAFCIHRRVRAGRLPTVSQQNEEPVPDFFFCFHVASFARVNSVPFFFGVQKKSLVM